MIVAIRTLATLLLILLPFASAQTQDDVLVEEQDVRRYTVEMIIFKYAQEVSVGSEVFPADQPLPAPLLDEGQMDEQASSAPESADEEAPALIRDIEYVVLERDDFSMNDIKRRLDLLEVYDPLMHFGWTQATWPEEQTTSIELAAFGRVPPGLDGRLTLYLSRFLHLVIDLELDAPESMHRDPVYDAPVSSYGDERARDALDTFGEPGLVHYRINENRILRNGELRYFDHPKFGVLAKVTRVEEDAQEPGVVPESADSPSG